MVGCFQSQHRSFHDYDHGDHVLDGYSADLALVDSSVVLAGPLSLPGWEEVEAEVATEKKTVWCVC